MPDRAFVMVGMALAVYAISITCTTSIIFERIRQRLRKQSPFLGQLFSCPFCFSFWTALGMLWISGTTLKLSTNSISDFILSTFAVIGLANMFSYIFIRLSKQTPG